MKGRLLPPLCAAVCCLATLLAAGKARADADGCGDLLWLSDWMAPILAPIRENDLPNTLGVGREAREKMTQGAVEGATRADKGHKRETTVASLGVNSPFNASRYLWLYRGDAPRCATAATTGPSLKVLGESGERSVPFLAAGDRLVAKFALDEIGNYSIYAVAATVRGRTLDLQIAKMQTARGGLREERAPDPAERPPLFDPTQALELVRERAADERFYTRLSPGDEAVFTVRSFGAPAPGVAVTLASQAGWRRTEIADAGGTVRFQLPRDDFAPRSEVRRSNWSTYLVSAERTFAQAGEREGAIYDNVRVRTTLAGRYYPSPLEYRSQALGLGIVAAVVVLVCTGVFLFRHLRARAFREVRFHEWN